jgi:hypothetical protein
LAEIRVQLLSEMLINKEEMGDEMDASIHRTGVAMRHTGIGRP